MSQAVGPRGPRIYNLFPLLVGAIADWMTHLPRIQAMGFNWVYVNPFHFPGFSGSLYAVKDYYRLNPTFRGAGYESDDDLIQDFTTAAAAHGMGVMMDLVINHTSKDSVLAQQHPEFFMRDEAGELVSPFAVDQDDPTKKTVWGDLAEIDFSERPARDAMIATWEDLVRHYVRLGVRGFRCDAAYKVPADVWQRVIAAAHAENPDVLFFAETLGCRLDEVEALRPARFDYIFNSAKWWDFGAPWLLEQYDQFRSIAPSIAFPESHDTPRLAGEMIAQGITDTRSIQAAYKQRYLFTAVFSAGVMMPIGFEYGFGTPVNVVTTRPEDWEEPRFDLSDFIGETNRLKAELSVLNQEGPMRRIASDSGAFGLLRQNDAGAEWVLIVINPDDNGAWSLETDGSDPVAALAVKGQEVTPGRARGAPELDGSGGLALKAGEIRLFAGTSSVE
ncbi:MAG: alpha-amylase [Rhodospirillaceae bacterium BRH_c57]|nr:MAG: alpha-amylase [Rhodospirillaceae bacterium BRH_c57]